METQGDAHEFDVMSSVFLRDSRPFAVGGGGRGGGKAVIVKLPVFEFPTDLLM